MIIFVILLSLRVLQSRDCYCIEIFDHSNCQFRSTCTWDVVSSTCKDTFCPTRLNEENCMTFNGQNQCIWNENTGSCYNLTNCSQIRTINMCFVQNCYWDYDTSQCGDEQKTCSDYTENCSSASEFGDKIYQCVQQQNNCAVLQQCSDVEDEMVCISQVGCQYNNSLCTFKECQDFNSTNCLPFNNLTQQMCISTNGTCKEYDCETMQDSNHCFSHPFCSWDYGSKRCQKYQCSLTTFIDQCVTTREDFGLTQCSWNSKKGCSGCGFGNLNQIPQIFMLSFLYLIL